MWNPFRNLFRREEAASATAIGAEITAAATRRIHDGEKFFGGFGPTEILTDDYWTLRARSAQLFKTNLYARGIIRRFVTNVINTGLHLEADPEPKLLDLPDDALADWSELTEAQFELWGKTPKACDHAERRTFGALQAAAYSEALVAGDVLAVLRRDPRSGRARLQLLSGGAIDTPFGKTPRGANRIVHGVELDPLDRHVAYWVRKSDPKSSRTEFTRIAAWSERTGRRNAWLVYGTDKRLDEVRGEPLLALVLQSLREIDRYRDSTQRKAVINSLLALFIKKTADKPGSSPITGGAISRRKITTPGDEQKAERTFNTAELIPGLVLDQLEEGEEPHGFQSHGTDEKFGDFEEAIIQTVAWAIETPPEILRLAFSNNYSASQAAINEYKMFLNRERVRFGDELCAPVYQDWLLSEGLLRRLGAESLVQAWHDRDEGRFAAWSASQWAGQIKPAVDLSKLVRGYQEMVAEGFVTRDRAARELTGMKFSKVAKQLALENAQLAEALLPLAKVERAPAERAPAERTPAESEQGDPPIGDDERERESS